MTQFIEFTRLIVIFLLFSNQGTSSELLVSPAGPTEMNVLAGSNVTLAVSFRGPRGPALTWYQGDFPVVTWIIDSPVAPVVAEDKRMVLRVELNGSLTFINVTPSCTSNYTVEMIKSGVGKSSTTFSLKVFEEIQEVTLRPQPDFAAEGDELFSLQYSVLRGVVEEQTWFFNGTRIKSNSHHSVKNRRLWIRRPHRNDTGQYSVTLTNPFSSGTARFNVTVRYGPEEPRVWADPAQPFYVTGDSLTLTCQADGFPQPSAEWLFGGRTLPESHGGVLNITTVQLSQGGVYTCALRNEDTTQYNTKSITVNVYERPPGDPVCSVQSVKDTELQYHCRWLGGAPEALLSLPGLNTSSSGAGNFNLNVTATDNLNGKTVICKADHPVEQNRCNMTARSPAEFLPTVRTVNLEGKIVVSIVCVSEASPKAVVSWFKGGVALTNDTTHQISSDTTQLNITHYNVSSFLHQNYVCRCRNPLGNQSREIQLKGPSVSRLSVVLSPDGTAVTLTWQVPSSSVVTGFDIQMKGPDLQNHNGSQSRGSSDRFRTITQAAGSARTTDIYGLDPDSTYRFRVIPKAHTTEGEPSEVRRIGPGEGLSGPAIAGIAAGIPCSLLFLLLLGGFIYLLVYCSKKKSRQTRYPVSRAIEKMTTQTEPTPHNLLSGGLKSLPDYNRLQQHPSERSVTLPNFVPPPPVRVATTV